MRVGAVLSYAVTYQGKKIILDSPLALEFAGALQMDTETNKEYI